MFTVEERNRVRDRLLALASSDQRVVAAAAVGSLVGGGGDHWSDLDLTFGVAEDTPVQEVIEDWTRVLEAELDAVVLVDLPVGATIYRVYLLPDWLQVDLSFSPASEFRQRSPRFELIFGSPEVAEPQPASAHGLFGWAVIFVRHARVCRDRGKPWQAEFCISAVRDYALDLACLRRGLPTGYGRGFDELPADVLEGFDDALVRSLDDDELTRALRAAVAALLRESAQVSELAAQVEGQLLGLAGPE